MADMGRAAAGVLARVASQIRVARAARPLTERWQQVPVEPCGQARIGISFRPLQAEALGLDPTATLAALLGYPFQLIRLGAYWNRIEDGPGRFDTTELDRQVDAAEQAGKQIILCVGPVKTFGYPEFFVPGHHLPEPLREGALIEPADHQSLLDAGTAYAARIVERYRDRRAIVAWQVEHDAVDPLGMEHSWRLSAAFVRQEVEAVRAADPTRPVMMNGFLPTSAPVRVQQWWRTRDQGDSLAVAQQLADIVGVDFYPRHALAARGGRTAYLAGSIQALRQRHELLRWAAADGRRLIIDEGQAEPWEAVTTPPSPPERAMYSCLPEHVIENYSQCMRWNQQGPCALDAYLFWGAEYWVLRRQQGDPRYLRAFARVLDEAASPDAHAAVGRCRPVTGRVPLWPAMTTRPDLPESGPRGPGARPRTAAARRWATDAAIAAVVIAAQVGGTYEGESHHGGAAAGPLAYVLLAVGGASLIARRRFPVGVLAVALVTTLWASGEDAHVIYLALIVAFFSAVLARKRAAAIASLIIGYAASVWPWLIGQSGRPSAAFALGLAAGLVFLLSAAELIRIRSQRTAALRRSREEELLRLASEERMRMARDLHDVVAHNISVINVQANTALHLMDRQPERARSALTTINEVSKQALVELRSVLGVLRDIDESAPRAPSPGLARIGDLADSAAAAGLAVHIEETDRPAPLPADVDLAAYRIVQEALTNSARHSGGTTATVRVSCDDGALVVEVYDDGAPRPAARASGPGNGIAGMTERAKALGGTLQAGPRPEGGFGVRTWLPLDGSGP